MQAVICFVCLAAAPEGRPFHEIHDDLRQLLQREATVRSDAEHARVIVQMTRLYREIADDPREPTSDTLQNYRYRLWSRLTRIKKELQARFEREGSRARRAPSGRRTAASAIPSSATENASYSLAGSLDLLGHSMGGPVGLLTHTRHSPPKGARGGAGVADFGPHLVELIHRTIAPDFWDVNGGPGSIIYYRPLHALVVRASGDVHGAVGGLLGGLK